MAQQEEFTTVVIGAGWSGLLAGVMLKDKNLAPGKDFVVLDAASGPGGVWHWNSFPGACCDIKSYYYLPLLDRTRFVPSRAYVRRSELLDYANHLIDHQGIRPSLRFGHFVKSVEYDEERQVWKIDVVTQEENAEIEFARHDPSALKAPKTATYIARHVVIGGGSLSYPRLPDFPGLDQFEGPVLHTQRWNHDLDGEFAGKRVGVVGVGCSSAQVITDIIHHDNPKGVKELYVFQRTPVWANPRGDEPTTAETREIIESGRAREVLTKHWNDVELRGINIMMHSDELNKGYTTMLAGKIRDQVKNPEIAEKLVPKMAFFGRRPLFMDNYWETFNDPRVTLVHDDKGVVRATKKGLVTGDGTEHEVDIVVCGAGFEFCRLAVNEVRGIGGVELNTLFGYVKDDDAPAHAVPSGHPRTVLGIHVPKFPNLYLMNSAQSFAPAANLTTHMEQQAEYIATLVQKAETENVLVEGPEELADSWTETCRKTAEGKVWHKYENYYNNYGSGDKAAAFWDYDDQYDKYRDEVLNEGKLDFPARKEVSVKA